MPAVRHFHRLRREEVRDTSGGFFYGPMGRQPPDHPAFESAGGHVARLDGAVEWRRIWETKKSATYNYPGNAYMG